MNKWQRARCNMQVAIGSMEYVMCNMLSATGLTIHTIGNRATATIDIGTIHKR